MSRATPMLIAFAGLLFFLGLTNRPADAADLPLRAGRHYAPHYCGPCGCLRVSYVYHSDIRSTYGLSFDPRNYDQTEPHFYPGPVRAYPRYSVAGCPLPGY